MNRHFRDAENARFECEKAKQAGMQLGILQEILTKKGSVVDIKFSLFKWSGTQIINLWGYREDGSSFDVSINLHRGQEVQGMELIAKIMQAAESELDTWIAVTQSDTVNVAMERGKQLEKTLSKTNGE